VASRIVEICPSSFTIELLAMGEKRFIWGLNQNIPRSLLRGHPIRLVTDRDSYLRYLAACSGVVDYKIDFGSGYRIYFGQDGNTLVILLRGGTKKTQQKDIDRAKDFWQEYKARKKSGG
jgi:hypothetical protein